MGFTYKSVISWIVFAFYLSIQKVNHFFWILCCKSYSWMAPVNNFNELIQSFFSMLPMHDDITNIPTLNWWLQLGSFWYLFFKSTYKDTVVSSSPRVDQSLCLWLCVFSVRNIFQDAQTSCCERTASLIKLSEDTVLLFLLPK